MQNEIWDQDGIFMSTKTPGQFFCLLFCEAQLPPKDPRVRPQTLAKFRPHFCVIYSVENTSLWFDSFVLQTFRLLQAIGSILQLVLSRVKYNSNSADFWYNTFLHWSVTETGWIQCLCLYWKIEKKGSVTESHTHTGHC